MRRPQKSHCLVPRDYLHSYRMSTKLRARRDPEGRRRTIVDAAVEVILADGLNDLSHRKVGAHAGVPLGSTTLYFTSLEELRVQALARLGRMIEEDLAKIETSLVAAVDLPRALAQMIGMCFEDPVRVKADTALYIGGAQDPQFHPLARVWFEGLIAVLSKYVDQSIARSVAVYTDGVMIHAILHESTLDEGFLAEALGRLMSGIGMDTEAAGRTDAHPHSGDE